MAKQWPGTTSCISLTYFHGHSMKMEHSRTGSLGYITAYPNGIIISINLTSSCVSLQKFLNGKIMVNGISHIQHHLWMDIWCMKQSSRMPITIVKSSQKWCSSQWWPHQLSYSITMDLLLTSRSKPKHQWKLCHQILHYCHKGIPPKKMHLHPSQKIAKILCYKCKEQICSASSSLNNYTIEKCLTIKLTLSPTSMVYSKTCHRCHSNCFDTSNPQIMSFHSIC